MTVTVTGIYRYPVKGLGAEPLAGIAARPGRGLAFDRVYALALAKTAFDAKNPAWRPKTDFLMLMRDEKLASLETAFDAASETLTVARGGKRVAEGCLATKAGRAAIEDFFADFMGAAAGGRPRLVSAPGHMFSDHKNQVLSLINMASLKELESAAQAPLDRLRFRANIYFDGAPAWSEFDWRDRDIAVGGAVLRVTQAIDRCAATNVEPGSGKRDQNLPKALQRAFGHVCFGIYGRVIEAGTIRPGDEIRMV